MLTFTSLLLITLIFCLTYFFSIKLKYFHFNFNDNIKYSNSNILISGGFFIGISFIFLNNYFHNSYISNYILLISIMFFALGFLDDFINLSAFTRIIFQIFLSFLAFYFLFNLYEPSLNLYLFNDINSKTFATFSIFFITILYVNAFNFIDGTDGLAGTQAFLFILFKFIIYSFYINIYPFEYFICLLSVIILFVIINTQKSVLRKMYLGNSGSLFLGSFLILLAINVNLDFDYYHPFIILWLCSYPLFNLGRVVIIRILNQKSIFLPDKNHFHHQLENQIKSHLMINIIISVIYCFFFVIGYFSTIFLIPEVNLLVFVLTFFTYFFAANKFLHK